jgi:hypothetical protein
MDINVFLWAIIILSACIGAYIAFTTIKTEKKKPILKKTPAMLPSHLMRLSIHFMMHIIWNGNLFVTKIDRYLLRLKR